MGRFLRNEIAEGRRYLPAGQHILRAFTRPIDDVRVLIVGQDPYPTPPGACCRPELLRGPRRASDSAVLGQHLHRVLFGSRVSDADQRRSHPVGRQRRPVAEPGADGRAGGEPASHRKKGWEAVTECAIKALVARDEPLVAILWGKDAAGLQEWLPDVPTIVSAHPSPLSASRGFFGSRPFSRANEELADLGADPVDWRLP